MTMKPGIKTMKTFGSMLACVVLASILGTLLLCGVYLLPTEPMERNVRKSAELLEHEGTYPALYSWCTSTLDNFTDAYMLLEASDHSEGTVLERALRNDPGICVRDPRKVLTDHYIEEEPLQESVGYPRYWHGYEIWLKPLLSLTDYAGIRMIRFFYQMGLMILTCILLWRKKMKRAILPLALCYLMMMPVVLARNMEMSGCFGVTLWTLIVLLLLKDNRKVPFLFLFAGITTAFFDFSTYPTLTFTMPAVLHFTMNPPENWKDTLRRFVRIGFYWVVGFAGMWAMKWTLATLVTGENVFADALNQIQVRTSDMHQDYVTHVSYFECAARNILWFVRTPATALVGLFCVWCVLPFGKKGKGGYGGGKTLPVLPYVLAALVPFAWFAVTINHSYMHIFFVCKTLAGPAFAVMIWITSIRKGDLSTRAFGSWSR